MEKKYSCNFEGTSCKASFTKLRDRKRHIQQFHLQARYYCRSCELQRGKIPFSSPRIERCRPHLVAGCNGVFFDPNDSWKTSWPLFFQKKSLEGAVSSVGSSLEVPVLPHPVDVRHFPTVDFSPMMMRLRSSTARLLEPECQRSFAGAALMPVSDTEYTLSCPKR